MQLFHVIREFTIIYQIVINVPLFELRNLFMLEFRKTSRSDPLIWTVHRVQKAIVQNDN